MSKNSNKKIPYQSGRIGIYVQAICKRYDLPEGEVRAFLGSNFPELKDKSHCANCTANMKAFWHKIGPGNVGSLIKAIEFVYSSNKNSFHPLRDLCLEPIEYTNFQKLRFHGLIAQVKGEEGHWLITTRGGQFLRGEISIPSEVKTFRNKVEEHSPNMVHIKDFRHQYPHFQSEFAYEYKKQESFLGIKQEPLALNLSR